MNLKHQVGVNIRNVRKSKSLSQAELAVAAKVDRSYVSEIELAKSSITLDILERIAKALDVKAAELFNEID
ncbi:helix-turn-helix domain-containing protein [Celeribacter marinus]|uniref:helix-turn-helix domain-containing protein n=1 Tax=Celeribacter marinus TaxID=1397108 RepID=UPI003F6D1449